MSSDNHIYWSDIHIDDRMKHGLSRKSKTYMHPTRGPLRIEHGDGRKVSAIERNRRSNGTLL